MLALPAAWGGAALIERVVPASNLRRIAWALPAIAMALVFAVFVREAYTEIFTQSKGRYAIAAPEVTGDGPVSPQIVDFLLRETDPEARVYFETSLGRIHDRGHMVGLYVLASGREFIGGPYPFIDFANSWDGFAFGRRLDDTPPVELDRLLDMYNVKWMLCHTASCRTAALSDGAVARAELGPVTAYERALDTSFFLKGSGRVVERCFNRLELAIDSREGVILKYHWVPGLAATPAAEVVPVLLVSGARPFIEIKNPPTRLVLSIGAPAAGCYGSATQ